MASIPPMLAIETIGLTRSRCQPDNDVTLSHGGLMRRNAFVGGLIFAGVLAAQDSPPLTFNKDVLPILQKNCQTCHRPGQVAPFSLLTYKDARPWANAMKT